MGRNRRQRRWSLLALTGMVGLCAGAAQAGADVDIKNLYVFGDSYSKLKRKGFPNWAEQLKNEGYVGTLRGYAQSGATATSAWSNNFAKQISAWKSSGLKFQANDATVVYFGYNDIDGLQDSFTASRTGYKAGLSALKSGGAMSSGRQVFTAMVHDWGSVPAYNGDSGLAKEYRDQTILWNKFIAGLPSQYSGVVPVDVYTPIQRVLANPKAYGFSNVKTADPSRSATTALYDDDYHFGRHGQQIIEQAMLNAMDRTGEYAKALSQGKKVQSVRQTQTKNGLAMSLASLDEEQQLGLVPFAVGTSALPAANEASDPARAAFDQLAAPDARDGGMGFNYKLSDATSFGVAFSSYDDAARSERQFGLAGSSLRSDGVSLYLQHRLGAFQLDTDFSYSNDRHQKLEYDAVADAHSRADFDGRSLALSQRVGLPFERKSFTLTPWAGLGYEVQQADSFTMSNPFVSDQTYAATSVSDTDASFGLDGSLRPIALGENRWLSLFAGMSYTHSLAHDDYEVRIKEAAFGNVQEDRIERPGTHLLALNLGSSVQMGTDLSLDAGLSLSQDFVTGSEQAGRVGLTYHFN